MSAVSFTPDDYRVRKPDAPTDEKIAVDIYDIVTDAVSSLGQLDQIKNFLDDIRDNTQEANNHLEQAVLNLLYVPTVVARLDNIQTIKTVKVIQVGAFALVQSSVDTITADAIAQNRLIAKIDVIPSGTSFTITTNYYKWS